jgi:hypothetical protein
VTNQDRSLTCLQQLKLPTSFSLQLAPFKKVTESILDFKFGRKCNLKLKRIEHDMILKYAMLFIFHTAQ